MTPSRLDNMPTAPAVRGHPEQIVVDSAAPAIYIVCHMRNEKQGAKGAFLETPKNGFLPLAESNTLGLPKGLAMGAFLAASSSSIL